MECLQGDTTPLSINTNYSLQYAPRVVHHHFYKMLIHPPLLEKKKKYGVNNHNRGFVKYFIIVKYLNIATVNVNSQICLALFNNHKFLLMDQF